MRQNNGRKIIGFEACSPHKRPIHARLKAAIRKQYRSVSEFERVMGLPNRSVTDLLRNRASRRVAEAINALLNNDPTHVVAGSDQFRAESLSTQPKINS